MKKISVIIPVYNTSDFLDLCLESVIKQTYKNLEIILIDDGSTDGSERICDKWKNKDSRIIVKHLSNSGVSNARNIGLSIATGDYISMLDSDDYIEKDMYQKMVDVFENNNVDIVMCNFYLKYPSSCIANKLNNSKKIIDKNKFINFICGEKSYGGYLWNKLYKRNIIYDEKHSVIFDSDVIIMEDLLFNCQLYPYISNVACLDDCFYYYRQRENSALNFHTLDKDKNSVLCLIKVINFLDLYNFKISSYYKLRFLVESFHIKTKDQKFYDEFLCYFRNKYFGLNLYLLKGNLKLKIKSLIIMFFPNLYLRMKGDK